MGCIFSCPSWAALLSTWPLALSRNGMKSNAKGAGVSLEITVPYKPAWTIYTARFPHVSHAAPTPHLNPVGCSSLCSPPTPGRGRWLGPDCLHSRDVSRRKAENWQPMAETREGWGWFRLLWIGSSKMQRCCSPHRAGNGPAAVAGSGEGAAVRLPRSRAGR